MLDRSNYRSRLSPCTREPRCPASFFHVVAFTRCTAYRWAAIEIRSDNEFLEIERALKKERNGEANFKRTRGTSVQMNFKCTYLSFRGLHSRIFIAIRIYCSCICDRGIRYCARPQILLHADYILLADA